MGTDFNPETHALALKPEYSVEKTEIKILRSAYGGSMFEENRTFDPAIVTSEEYENYYYLGFHFIFDFVEKI